LSWAGVTFT